MLVPCRCRCASPQEGDHHGTGPDGHVARVVAGPQCDLCGGSGRTTRARLRAASAARGLVLAGLVLGALALGAALVALLSKGGFSGALTLSAAGLAALGMAGGLELLLARTAPRGPA